MKRIVLLNIVLLITVMACAQGKVVTLITNARNDRGVCRVCLFNNASSFSGDGGAPVMCVRVPVKNGRSEALFQNIAAGEYAIAVFHDVNDNAIMDKNFLGIPKEGYGASRNNLPFASAPGFAENKFAVPDKTTTTLHIRLRNL